MGVDDDDDGLTAAEGLAVMQQFGYVTRGPLLERIECEHDFHTGNAPCTKCGKTVDECNLNPGDDDEQRRLAAPVDKIELEGEWTYENALTITLENPDRRRMTDQERHAIRYPPWWNRMDEVALAYKLLRRRGEDDAMLAIRIRRFVASSPGIKVPPLPPWDWVPPRPPTRARAPFAEEFVVDPETGATKRVT